MSTFTIVHVVIEEAGKNMPTYQPVLAVNMPADEAKLFLKNLGGGSVELRDGSWVVWEGLRYRVTFRPQ